MAREALYPVRVSTMISEPADQRIKATAEDQHVSENTVRRESIDYGLAIVEDTELHRRVRAIEHAFGVSAGEAMLMIVKAGIPAVEASRKPSRTR